MGNFENLFKNVLTTAFDIVHDWSVHRFTYYVLGISAILLHKDVVNP